MSIKIIKKKNSSGVLFVPCSMVRLFVRRARVKSWDVLGKELGYPITHCDSFPFRPISRLLPKIHCDPTITDSLYVCPEMWF